MSSALGSTAIALQRPVFDFFTAAGMVLLALLMTEHRFRTLVIRWPLNRKPSRHT